MTKLMVNQSISVHNVQQLVAAGISLSLRLKATYHSRSRIVSQSGGYLKKEMLSQLHLLISVGILNNFFTE